MDVTIDAGLAEMQPPTASRARDRLRLPDRGLLPPFSHNRHDLGKNGKAPLDRVCALFALFASAANPLVAVCQGFGQRVALDAWPPRSAAVTDHNPLDFVDVAASGAHHGSTLASGVVLAVVHLASDGIFSGVHRGEPTTRSVGRAGLPIITDSETRRTAGKSHPDDHG